MFYQNDNFYRFDRTSDSGKCSGGGLCAYISDKLNVEHLDFHNVCNKNIEAQWLKLKLPDTRDTIIGNIYRPPGVCVEEAFKYIEDKVGEFEGTRNPDLLIAGDFNVDLLKNTSQTGLAKSFMKNTMMSQLVKTATRSTNSGQTLIDHIYVSNTDFYQAGFVTDPGLSDHNLVVTTRKGAKIKHETTYIIGRSYRSFDENLYYRDVASLPWYLVYECTDVNIAAELFTNMLLSVANHHAPFKRIKSRSNQPKWITSEFLSLLDEKQHACNIHRRPPSQYTAARKRMCMRRVAVIKRRLKRSYIFESLKECEGDMKKPWRLIKELWPTQNPRTKLSIGLYPLKNYRSDTPNTTVNAVGERLPAVERSNLGQRLSVDGRHTKG